MNESSLPLSVFLRLEFVGAGVDGRRGRRRRARERYERTGGRLRRVAIGNGRFLGGVGHVQGGSVVGGFTFSPFAALTITGAARAVLLDVGADRRASFRLGTRLAI